jgi:hypothetical protein
MKKYIIFYVLGIFLTISCHSDEDQESSFEDSPFVKTRLSYMNMPRPEDSYNYPIYPGTKEWVHLSTGQEMMDACQIPADKLKNMSTQAVIQAIWEHPLLFTIFHRNQYQIDFEDIFLTNNAYRDLSARADGGVGLLKRLKLVDPLSIEALHSLELLLAQTVFISQLTNEEKKSVVEITLNNNHLLQGYIADDVHHRTIACLLIGKILAGAYPPFKEEVSCDELLKSFLELNTYVSLKGAYGNIPQQIINYAINFIE